jgi:hypothetical protein
MSSAVSGSNFPVLFSKTAEVSYGSEYLAHAGAFAPSALRM